MVAEEDSLSILAHIPVRASRYVMISPKKWTQPCVPTWVISGDAGNIGLMANNPEETKPSEGEGATAAGMVEAVTQDVELIVERVVDTAHEAVAAVGKKLGARPRKPAKPKAKAPKPKAKTSKARKAKPMKAKAVKAKPRKAAKASKGKKVRRKR